jgi:hypothetical protein
MEQSGILATSPGYIGQAGAGLQLAQAVVVGKVGSYSYILGIPIEVLACTLFYALAGVLAVLIHRYFTHGPADPFGEWVEVTGFWLLLAFGPLGLLVGLYCAGEYLLEKHGLRKKLKEYPFKKERKRSQTLELFHSPSTGLLMERLVHTYKNH